MTAGRASADASETRAVLVEPRQRGAALPQDLRARLTSARAAAGLTHRQLGEVIGVAHAHLWRIEHAERRPSAAVARLLAEALRLDTSSVQALLAASAADAGRSRGRDDAV